MRVAADAVIEAVHINGVGVDNGCEVAVAHAGYLLFFQRQSANEARH